MDNNAKNTSIEVVEKIASQLDGINIRERFPQDLIKLASSHKIAILYGASDDLLEIDGYLYDELSAYNGLSYRELEPDNVEEAVFKTLTKHEIELIWCPDNEKSWAFKVSDKSTFKRFNIMEDGEVFSEGVVLLLD